MKVNVEELSPIERKLSIEVESARVAEELDRAYASLGRQVKVAGFRPGKIPRRILEQRFKGEIEGDVIRRVVERAYFDAIRDHNVEAVGTPHVTPGGLNPNEPFSFQATVEVKPKIEPKDYRGLALRKREAKVDDQKVSERIEKLREGHSRLEPVTDRDVAQRGDFATIDYDATIDGKPFAGSKAESMTVEVAPGELIESKIASLEGVKVGETKEIDYIFPPDYSVEEVKGKLARFKLHLKGLKTKIVPELNDDFAKETGAAQTLDELRTRVREDLERAEKNRQASEEREEIIAQIISKNSLEVPKAMVERALDLMLQGALRMMARSGMDPRMLNLDFSSLREEMRAKAETEVKGTLLLEAIAEQEKLEVSDDEVNKRIEKIAEEAGQGLAQVRKQFKDSENQESLKLRIREEKTLEWLKANASYA